MTRSLALCLIASLFSAPIAHAEEIPAQSPSTTDAQPSATSDARQIIEQQLAAFERDDAVEAYSYATPQIQALFPDPNLFLYMVETAYPAVRRHRSVEFGPAAEEGGAVAETVIFTDEEGQVWTALYKLEKEPQGAWKISGVVLSKSDQKGL